MSELEYLQLAGHITVKLDNTAQYEDWIQIQEYVIDLQSNLTKEQLAYGYLRDSFNKQNRENQQLKKQLQQRDSVIEEAIKYINFLALNIQGLYDEKAKFGFIKFNQTIWGEELLDILNKYKKEENE